MTIYKVKFEFETDEFVDERDLELNLEKLFPNWDKIIAELKEKQ